MLLSYEHSDMGNSPHGKVNNNVGHLMLSE